MRKRQKVVLILFTIFIVFLLYQTFSNQKIEQVKQQSQLTTTIPHKMWTFWNTEQPPHLILLCIESWRRWNPGYNVTLLTPLTVHLYLTAVEPFDYEKVLPAHWSDWIRLAIVMEHGGIWLDASTILTLPIETILTQASPTTLDVDPVWLYSVNSTNREIPLIDNWFIASPPRSLLITAWFLELSLAMRTLDTYFSDLQTLYPSFYPSLIEGIDGNNEHGLSYFRGNIVLQKLFYIHGIPIPHVFESEKGPMRLYFESNWNGIEYARRLVTTETPNYGIYKLTHHSRDEIVRLSSQTHPKSVYATLLM
jgi:hypothetical protein